MGWHIKLGDNVLREYLSHHRAVSLEVGVSSIPPIKVSLRVKR